MGNQLLVFAIFVFCFGLYLLGNHIENRQRRAHFQTQLILEAKVIDKKFSRKWSFATDGTGVEIGPAGYEYTITYRYTAGEKEIEKTVSPGIVDTKEAAEAALSKIGETILIWFDPALQESEICQLEVTHETEMSLSGPQSSLGDSSPG